MVIKIFLRKIKRAWNLILWSEKACIRWNIDKDVKIKWRDNHQIILYMAKWYWTLTLHLPGASYSSDGEESTCNAGDPSSIPGWGRSSGEKNGNPLQYSSPENSMDRGARQAVVHRATKNQTQLSNWMRIYIHTLSLGFPWVVLKLYYALWDFIQF